MLFVVDHKALRSVTVSASITKRLAKFVVEWTNKKGVLRYYSKNGTRRAIFQNVNV